MVNLIVIAAIIIGAMAVVLILAPRVKRWIKSRMLKENVRQFRFTIVQLPAEGINRVHQILEIYTREFRKTVFNRSVK